jgi:hypothetical protein
MTLAMLLLIACTLLQVVPLSECAGAQGSPVHGSEAPNMRLKLSARGGHIWRYKSVLSVAAAGRSLSATR